MVFSLSGGLTEEGVTANRLDGTLTADDEEGKRCKEGLHDRLLLNYELERR